MLKFGYQFLLVSWNAVSVSCRALLSSATVGGPMNETLCDHKAYMCDWVKMQVILVMGLQLQICEFIYLKSCAKFSLYHQHCKLWPSYLCLFHLLKLLRLKPSNHDQLKLFFYLTFFCYNKTSTSLACRAVFSVFITRTC